MSITRKAEDAKKYVWVQLAYGEDQNDLVEIQNNLFRIKVLPVDVFELIETVYPDEKPVFYSTVNVYRLNNEGILSEGNHAVVSLNRNCTKLSPKTKMRSLHLREDNTFIVVAPKPQHQQQQQVSYVPVFNF